MKIAILPKNIECCDGLRPGSCHPAGPATTKGPGTFVAVFAMDGAVSLQNRQPAACQPPPSLRFRCIWVKRLLQAGVALYTRAVYRSSIKPQVERLHKGFAS